MVAWLIWQLNPPRVLAYIGDQGWLTVFDNPAG
jgi:hypothetical protein